MMSLLIVEENDRMRRLLKSLVAGLVFPVHECGDGAEALAVYSAQLPNWVLIDIDLRTNDGIAVMHKIKAAYPEAHIIIVTNFDDAELRLAARAAGAYGYVLKENLLVIRELIKHDKGTENESSKEVDRQPGALDARAWTDSKC